jgi:hypothetical protein
MENTMSNLEGGRRPHRVRKKRFSGAKHKFRKTFSTGRSRKIRRTLKSQGVHKSHIKGRRRNPLRRKTLKVRKSELYSAQQKQQYKVAKSQAGLNVASASMKKRQGSIATTSSDLQGAKERKNQLTNNLAARMKRIIDSKKTRDKQSGVLKFDKSVKKNLKSELKQLKKNAKKIKSGTDENILQQKKIKAKEGALKESKTSISKKSNELKATKKTLKSEAKEKKSLDSNLKRTKKVEKAHEKSLKKDQKQLQKNSKTFDKAEKRLTKSKNTSQAKLEKRLKKYTEQVNKQEKKFDRKTQSYQDAVVLTKNKKFFNPTKYRLFSRNARRARAMRKTAKKLSQSDEDKYKGVDVDNLMRRNNVMKKAKATRKKGNFKTYQKNSNNGTNKNLMINSKITLGKTNSIIKEASSQKQSADDFAKYARLKRKERTNKKRTLDETEGKRQYNETPQTLGRQGPKYQRSLDRKTERNSQKTEGNTAVETEISRIQQINKYKKERENDFQQEYKNLSGKNSNEITRLRQQHRNNYAKKLIPTNASQYIEGDNRRSLAKQTETLKEMARLSINGELTKTSDIKKYDTRKFSSPEQKALRVDFFKASGWDKKKYGEYKALKEKALHFNKLNEQEKLDYKKFQEDRRKLKEVYNIKFLMSTTSEA